MKAAPLFIHLSNFPPFPYSSPVQKPQCEFHILAEVRNRYQFDESLFLSNGNVIFPNFHAARVFAKKLNDRRDLVKFPEQTVRAGKLNAMGLIDEIYHYIVRLYEETTNPGVFERAHAHLQSRLGEEELQKTLESFAALFPPIAVYKNKSSIKKYLDQKTDLRSNLYITIEELMLLYFENFNPAASMFAELFTDKSLSEKTKYQSLIGELEEFFKKEKKFGPDNQFIFDLLRAPILANPDSLEAQLRFMKEKWGMILSDKFLDRILGSMDFLEEENKQVFGGGAHAPVPVYQPIGSGGDISYGSFESERFTTDLEWMPKVVILAKNTYVWLDQLSKTYRRPIARLDQIPDEELDQLARWNFTGLWLIGLWERSNASQKIKQWTGNPEAVPSAYSLYDYEIARDLGGEDAFQNLNHRAWHRGIRLAGDMVPNHMGIFSKWVVEHPEYFIQSDYCPFPNYRFTGGDLSEDPNVQLRIEDGYWSRKDAAVVFQRIDNRMGSTTYIYHGNDGTNMPWNDTAQLDLLRADVREAVIQTIFHVARKFSIIRFDAAMTLTKKHFQRLWYPQPGTGGDIPSRADRALSKEKFDELFPAEFWRDVVDRINQYMPSTLLLAEAFWLMEGYFVRTLGMHRVYNSAFMHMLMKEENEKYHQLIKNTLEFNPEILKRYVNFMSNPDEQTAIAQFGKDDKYFGVALMMVTLPGLPMFGHAQIEGFTEKYGMEYKRAYYDELPDEQLIRRHEHEIFPIMKRRHLFSDVTNFELYEFRDSHGHTNHNVFAYSNMAGGERALIFYHNKYQECKGWIRWSAQKSRSVEGGGRKNTTRTLGAALGINPAEKYFYVFKDYKTNLEFIRSGRELHERGMYAELRAFEYHIFLDFREVYDTTGEYDHIARQLRGQGVSSIQHAFLEIKQAPIHEAAKALFSPSNVAALKTYCLGTRRSKASVKRATEIVHQFNALFEEIKKYVGATNGVNVITNRFETDIDTVTDTWQFLKSAPAHPTKNKNRDWTTDVRKARIFKDLEEPAYWGIVFAWMVAEKLTHFVLEGHAPPQPADLFTMLGLEKPFGKLLSSGGRNQEEVQRDLCLVRILSKHPSLLTDANANNRFLKMEQLFNDYDVREFIKLNLFKETWYYNKECFAELLNWLLLVSLIHDWKSDTQSVQLTESAREKKYVFVKGMLQLSDKAGYQIEKLRTLLSPDES